MRIAETIKGLIAESHATGYGCELPASIERLFHTLAEHVDQLGAGVAPDLEPIKVQINDAFGLLQAKHDAAIEKLHADLAQHLSAELEPLKAKLAQLEPLLDLPLNVLHQAVQTVGQAAAASGAETPAPAAEPHAAA